MNSKNIWRQQTQEIPEELESRKRTLTLKGFEYQLPFRKKNYQDAVVKLRNCVDRVDMLSTDENVTSTLRQSIVNRWNGMQVCIPVL